MKIIALLTAVLLLASCFSDFGSDGDGEVVINTGAGSGRALNQGSQPPSSEALGKTTFVVTFKPTDGGRTIERSFSGTSTGRISVPAGKYEITVEAVIEGTAYAASIKSTDTVPTPVIAEITSGRNDPINVNMHYIGDGTAANPFLVFDVETLLAVGRNAVGAGRFSGWTNATNIYYKLITNINLSGVTWTRIPGTFSGNFDGSGKTISGLTISTPSEITTGMFANNSGTIKNLNLTGVNINGGNDTGSIAGENTGTIQYCSSSGRITGGTSVGGIAGGNDGQVISCYSNANVNGNVRIGGIVGSNSASSLVQYCYSTGVIKGEQMNVGGIAGVNEFNGVVEYCYSTSIIPGPTTFAGAGGIVGNNGNIVRFCVALNSSIFYEYNNDTRIGRIVGTDNSSTKTNNYASSKIIMKNSGTTVSPTSSLNGKDGETLTVSNRGTAQSYLNNCPGGAPDLSKYY